MSATLTQKAEIVAGLALIGLAAVLVGLTGGQVQSGSRAHAGVSRETAGPILMPEVVVTAEPMAPIMPEIVVTAEPDVPIMSPVVVTAERPSSSKAVPASAPAGKAGISARPEGVGGKPDNSWRGAVIGPGHGTLRSAPAIARPIVE